MPAKMKFMKVVFLRPSQSRVIRLIGITGNGGGGWGGGGRGDKVGH